MTATNKRVNEEDCLQQILSFANALRISDYCPVTEKSDVLIPIELTNQDSDYRGYKFICSACRHILFEYIEEIDPKLWYIPLGNNATSLVSHLSLDPLTEEASRIPIDEMLFIRRLS